MADTLAARLLASVEPMLEEPAAGRYFNVLFPGDLDPFERHGRFGTPLDAELRLAGAGCADGGCTLYEPGDEDDGDGDGDGAPRAVFTILDCEATDLDAARAIVRAHLPDLGCPAGTMVQWDEHEDRWDGAAWHLAVPRSHWEEE